MGRWTEEAVGERRYFKNLQGDEMSKLLSILVAAVFALSTGSVFAAAHMKAAAGDKKEEVKKEEAKAEVKKEMKEAKKEVVKDEKKAKADAKKEAKKAKADAAKEAKIAKADAKKDMKKEEKAEVKK